eukprot:gnl/TRDRNA2_/TRDRNA2_165836_c0_seq1.p1 gnl/TRDRNA2_/TRDRNA2_165836_c0~~gnl/TRDRNA2_/TRDRNA2_165836_c0_seq1.p1  ORF type:complete len:175 (-),score=21.14 gnl/TRDRNA2_/TRDRNA2_165836_c0_seq1:73-597(-)
MPIFHPSRSRSRSHSGERGERRGRKASRDDRRRSRSRSSPRRRKRSKSKSPARTRSRSRGKDKVKDDPGHILGARVRTDDENPDAEEPLFDIEPGTKRSNGDPTYQACVQVKGLGGRMRTIRGPPRIRKEDSEVDCEEMRKGFRKGGLPLLRKVQQFQRDEHSSERQKDYPGLD